MALTGPLVGCSAQPTQGTWPTAVGKSGSGATEEAADRAAVGAQLAGELGLKYVQAPERFGGRLYACPQSPAGREYVRVVDLATGQFTLAPKPRDAARLEGRIVSATLDRERRLTVQLERGRSR